MIVIIIFGNLMGSFNMTRTILWYNFWMDMINQFLTVVIFTIISRTKFKKRVLFLGAVIAVVGAFLDTLHNDIGYLTLLLFLVGVIWIYHRDPIVTYNQLMVSFIIVIIGITLTFRLLMFKYPIFLPQIGTYAIINGKMLLSYSLIMVAFVSVMLLLIKEAHQRKISQLNAYGGEKTQLIVAMFLSAYVIAIMAMDQLALFNPKDGTFLYAILSVFILAGSIFGGLMIYITVAIKRNRQLIYEQNYQNLALYLTELETSYNKLRHFKHDYKNSLLTLKIYQQQSDPLKVFDALDQLIDIEGKQTNELPTIHELDHIQSIPIKGIIYTKVLKARKKNIRTSLRIEPIQDITEFEWSVNEILGILLDNAIQASELVDNPWIEIVAYEHLGVVEFVILNCVDDSTQSIDWMMTSGHTTKNSGQGIGLNSLQEQVSEHDNMFFSMQRENNCVKAILTIEV